MTTIETLTAELNQAKLNIKLAEAITTIVEAFKNKEDYVFETNYSPCSLFENNFISCGKLSLRLNHVKHYEEMFEICFDKKTTSVKKIKAAVKLYEGEQAKENFMATELMRSIRKELNQ